MANLTILNKVGKDAHIYDVVAPAGLENGNMLLLGTRNTDATYNVSAPTAITNNGLVIVACVNLPYEAEKEENDYVIATAEVTRAYVPEVGQVMSFPTANFTATVASAVGKFIIPDVGALKMEIVNALGGTESVAYVIDQVYTKAGVAMTKMRCVKA